MRLYVPITDIAGFDRKSRKHMCSQLKRDMVNDLAKILKSNSKRIDRCHTMKRFKCNTNDLLGYLDKLLIVSCYRKGILISCDRSIKHNGVMISSLLDAIHYGVRGIHPPIVSDLSRFVNFWSHNLASYFKMVLYDRELG